MAKPTNSTGAFPGFIFVYGPPGSGKTATGQALAAALDLPFWDLDHEIETNSGWKVAEIFARQGEAAFRAMEAAALEAVLEKGTGVVALGGGALLDSHSRAQVEAAGNVVCLAAPFEALLARVRQAAGVRPLLQAQGSGMEAAGEKLKALLAQRAGHYASFPLQIDTASLGPSEAAWEAQVGLGWFRVQGMGQAYPVFVLPGAIGQAGAAWQHCGSGGPVALVSDRNVAARYAAQARQAFEGGGHRVHEIILEPGEATKTPSTLEALWAGMVQAGVERGSSVAALGGGVVSDLAGFAAATYLRGVAWGALPTTLLAMCDAAIGGKTGADLPQGKNLIGAFHPPRLVLADPLVLGSLPVDELRSGMAEVIKAGVIGDPALFDLCAGGWQVVEANWTEVVSRAAGVKIRVIQADPFEKGVRATLNLGHTAGHALEWATGYRLRHGEAVATGMIVAARLSARLGLAEPGLEELLTTTLEKYSLPTRIPASVTVEALLAGMRVDKKRSGGKARFVLPLRIGAVQHGIIIEEPQLCEVFLSCMDPT